MEASTIVIHLDRSLNTHTGREMASITVDVASVDGKTMSYFDAQPVEAGQDARDVLAAMLSTTMARLGEKGVTLQRREMCVRAKAA